MDGNTLSLIPLGDTTHYVLDVTVKRNEDLHAPHISKLSSQEWEEKGFDN
jgi:hypothetical protein